MISLNYRDSRPIYEQIKDGFKKLIATGAMERTKSCRLSGRLPRSFPSTPTPFSGPMPSWRAKGTPIPSPERAALPPPGARPTGPAKQN